MEIPGGDPYNSGELEWYAFIFFHFILSELNDLHQVTSLQNIMALYIPMCYEWVKIQIHGLNLELLLFPRRKGVKIGQTPNILNLSLILVGLFFKIP